MALLLGSRSVTLLPSVHVHVFIVLMLKIYLFIYLAAPGLLFSCSTWDPLSLLGHAGSLVTAWDVELWHVGSSSQIRGLVPGPGMEPGPPAIGSTDLSHWTTRKVPRVYLGFQPSWWCLNFKGNAHFISKRLIHLSPRGNGIYGVRDTFSYGIWGVSWVPMRSRWPNDDEAGKLRAIRWMADLFYSPVWIAIAVICLSGKWWSLRKAASSAGNWVTQVPFLETTGVLWSASVKCLCVLPILRDKY